MNEDPWKHRSANMSCATCMWFVPKITQKPHIPEYEQMIFVEPDDKIGRCRRHAPTMNGYPVVFKNDWCGDHKLDENKI